MATNEETLRKWENGRSPQPGSYPTIIRFLGQAPWPEPTSFPQQLRCARLARGLTIAQAAVVLGVDPSTLRWWEAGRKSRRIEHRERLNAFLAADTSSTTAGSVQAETGSRELAEPSLAALLRTRREELGHTQVVTAACIGANPWTLLGWEQDRRTPADRFYPAVIRYLGREPWPVPQSLGEQLRAERLRRGFCLEQAAAVIQVSPDSLSDWESGRLPRHELSKRKIDAFLTGATRPSRHRRGKA